ncbi:MAG TPA: hypothetical protein VI072_28225 [Polyangiaceae bacterium]
MSDANGKNAGGAPPEAVAAEDAPDAGHATEAMTAPPRPTPQGPAQRTQELAAEEPPAAAGRRVVPATALIQQPAPQPVLRTAHDADPATLRDANPPWQRPGNTEMGEPPVMDAAPPAPLAPPVAFAPLPSPNVPMQHATPPINAAPAYGAPAYYAPRRPRGNGMLLIGAGLFGFVLLLGAAVALILWMRAAEGDEATEAITSSAPPVQVAPEVATVEPVVPPAPAPVAEEPAPEPKPAPRKKPPPAAAAPAVEPPPALPAPPVERAPPPADTPPTTPSESENPAPAPPAEPLPPSPAPRRRIPRRIGQ